MNSQMKEELRRSFVRDPQVQMMISIRAFEIYKGRGGGGGARSNEIEDWFRAENEIVTRLIEDEERRQAAREVEGDQFAKAVSTPGIEPSIEPNLKTKRGAGRTGIASKRTKKVKSAGENALNSTIDLSGTGLSKKDSKKAADRTNLPKKHDGKLKKLKKKKKEPHEEI
jgi:hypothetical protein